MIDKIKTNPIYIFYAVLFLQVLLGIYNVINPTNSFNKYMFISNYIFLFAIVLTLIKDGLVKNFLICSFYGCFFLFLMSQKVFLAPFDVFRTFVKTSLTIREYSIFALIMSIGIICPFIGYKLFRFDNSKENTVLKTPKNFINVIRIGFFITLPFAFYMQAYQVIARLGMSYTDGYLINVEFPAMIKITNYLFPFFSLAYLAMKPKKLEMYIVLVLHFVVEGGIQLVQGRRAMFAVSFLFAIWYLFKYYDVKKLHKKLFISLFSAGIAIVVLFYFVEMYRGDVGINDTSLLHIIREFMISTGGSDSVIANTIRNADSFPKDGYRYLFDPFVNNPFINLFNGNGGVPQGALYLLKFDSFPHWISFLTSSSYYLRGHGMGTSYLAELYLAFGFVGVGVFSILLGKIIYILQNTNFNQNFYRITLSFFFISRLFTLPRSGAFEWFLMFPYFMVALCITLPFYFYLRHKEVKLDGK